jgi:transposase-like protein
MKQRSKEEVEAMRERIVKLGKDPEITTTQIAARLGCSPKTVLDVLRTAGMLGPKQPQRLKGVPVSPPKAPQVTHSKWHC